MQKKEKVNYVAVGIFLFIGFVLMIVGIYFAGRYSFVLKGGYTLNVTYTFLDDLTPGSKVRIGGGVDIGKVYSIELDGDKMVAVLAIDKGYEINRSATFHIFSTGLVGMKYIDVQGYDPNEGSFYEAGETIEGHTPMSMAVMFESIGELAGIFTTDEGLQGFSSAFDELGSLLDNINSVFSEDGLATTMWQLNSSLSHIDDLIVSMEETVSNLNGISGSLNEEISGIEEGSFAQITEDINTISSELALLSEKMNDDDGIADLLSDPEFSESLRITLANLEEFSEILVEKPNSVVFGYKDKEDE